MKDLIKLVEAEYMREDLPSFKAGDRLDVYVKISEGGKERIQVFQGDVIQIKGHGATKTFTVRKISKGGFGVERIFPFASPNIEKIEVLRRGIVRRARIYYLRGLSGKSARIRERR